MKRQIIEINEQACTGCGICAEACHEGAIEIIDGVAKLIREDYCDGFGDCLPQCPTGAITFVEREAPAYDAQAVEAAKRAKESAAHAGRTSGGCPGAAVRSFSREPEAQSSANPSAEALRSQLGNWPVQIKLAPVQAPYFDGAHLLIAADCCAYSYAAFHHDFLRERICLIGCPKLDAVDYTGKLAQILVANDIQSLTITRMEVPCCAGLERAAVEALRQSGKSIPVHVTTFTLDGQILA